MALSGSPDRPKTPRRLGQWLANSAGALAQNGFIVAGAAALAHGVARIYAPAGEIVLGLEVLGLAYLLAKGAA